MVRGHPRNSAFDQVGLFYVLLFCVVNSVEGLRDWHKVWLGQTMLGPRFACHAGSGLQKGTGV